MRLLKEREEIGRAMNFGKYPVLHINMENNKGYGEGYAEGDLVKVNFEAPRFEGLTTRGNIICEDGKFRITNNSVCLKASFGYSDVMEDMMWANAPLVNKSQEVVVIMDWPSKKGCTVAIMKVSDRIDTNCMIVAELS